MTRCLRRERRLLGGALLSGVLVLFSHAGGPLSCSVPGVRVRDAGNLFDLATTFRPGVRAGLLLTRRNSAETTNIVPGTLISLNGDDSRLLLLVGFDPATRDVLVSEDGEHVQIVPPTDIQSIAVLGGKRGGAYAGNGALIGGVSGAIVGVAIAGNGSNNDFVGCALIGGSALGTGVGAATGGIIGAAAGRPRTEYVIGSNDWYVGAQPEPPKPVAPKPPPLPPLPPPSTSASP